jgi:single-stranded-DNA-specific exonuclease
MLADEIEQLNERRRADSARVLREAELMIGLDKSLLDRKALILAGKRWPSGLLGPVAAQLVAQHRRPVVIFSDDGQHAHGSARSVPGLDITAVIRANSDLLERFGGHGQAAGLSLRSTAIPAFADALDAEIEAAGVEVPYQPVLQLDAEIADDRLHLSTAELLQKLEPHGKGNEQPLLLIRDVSVRQYEAIGSDRSHLRFQLGVPGGTVKAIAFGMAARSKELVTARGIDIAAALKIDTWNGQRRLDVEIKDFRPAT